MLSRQWQWTQVLILILVPGTALADAFMPQPPDVVSPSRPISADDVQTRVPPLQFDATADPPPRSTSSSPSARVPPLVLALPSGVLFAPVAFLYGPFGASTFPPLATVMMDATTGAFTPPPASAPGPPPSISCQNVSALRCYLPTTAMLEPIPRDQRTTGGGPDTGGPTAVATGTCAADLTSNSASFNVASSASTASTNTSPLPASIFGAVGAVVVDSSAGMVRGPSGGLQPYTDNHISLGTVSDRWWPVLNLTALANLPPPAVTRDGAEDATASADINHNSMLTGGVTSLCLLEAFAQAASDTNQSDTHDHFPMTLLGYVSVSTSSGPIISEDATNVTMPVARLTGLLLTYAFFNSTSNHSVNRSNFTGGVPLCSQSGHKTTSLTSHTTSVLFTPANIQGPSLKTDNRRAYVPLVACTQGADANALVNGAALVVGYNPNAADAHQARTFPSSDPFGMPSNPPIILPSRAYTESGVPSGSLVGRGPFDNDTWTTLVRQCSDSDYTGGYAALTTAQLDATDIGVCVADLVVLSVGGGPRGLGKDFYSLFPSDAILLRLQACLSAVGWTPSMAANVLAVSTVLVGESLVTISQYSQYPTPSIKESIASLLVLRLNKCSAEYGSQDIFPPVCPWTYPAADLQQQGEGKGGGSQYKGGAFTPRTIAWGFNYDNINANMLNANEVLDSAAQSLSSSSGSESPIIGVLPPGQCTPLATFLASFATSAAVVSRFATYVDTDSCQRVVAPPTPRDTYGLYTTNLRYNFMQVAAHPSARPDLFVLPLWVSSLLTSCADLATVPMRTTADDTNANASLKEGSSNRRQHATNSIRNAPPPPAMTSSTWWDAAANPPSRRPLTDAEALCAFGQYITGSPSMATMAVQWSCAADGSGTVFMSSCSSTQSAPPLPWEARWRAFIRDNPSAARYASTPSSQPSSFPDRNAATLLMPPYFADNSGGLPLIAVSAVLPALSATGRSMRVPGDLATLLVFRCSVCTMIGLEPGMAPLPYALVVASALKDAVVIALGVWILSQPRPRRVFASFVANISTVLIPLRDPALTAAVRVSVQRALSPTSITPTELVGNLRSFVTWATASAVGHHPVEERMEGSMHNAPTLIREGDTADHPPVLLSEWNRKGQRRSSCDRPPRAGDVRTTTTRASTTPEQHDGVEAAAFAVYCLLYVMRGGQRCIQMDALLPARPLPAADAMQDVGTPVKDNHSSSSRKSVKTGDDHDVCLQEDSDSALSPGKDEMLVEAAMASRAELRTKLAVLRSAFGMCFADSCHSCSVREGAARDVQADQQRALYSPQSAPVVTADGPVGMEEECEGAVDAFADASDSAGLASTLRTRFSLHRSGDSRRSSHRQRQTATTTSPNASNNNHTASTSRDCLLRVRVTPSFREEEHLNALQQATKALWASLEARQALHPAVFARDMIDRRITPPAWLLSLHILYVLVLFAIHAISVWRLGAASAPSAVLGGGALGGGLLATPWARYQSFYFRFVNATTVVGLLVDALLRVWYSPPLPPSLDRPLRPATMDALVSAVMAAEMTATGTEATTEPEGTAHRLSRDFAKDAKPSSSIEPTSSSTAVILRVFLRQIESERTPAKLLRASGRDPFVIAAIILPLPVLLTHAVPGIVLYAWVVLPLTAALALLALLPRSLLSMLQYHRRLCAQRNDPHDHKDDPSSSTTAPDEVRAPMAGQDTHTDQIPLLQAPPWRAYTSPTIPRAPTPRPPPTQPRSSPSVFWVVAARLLVRIVLTIACTVLIQSSVNWMVLAYTGGGQSRVGIPQLWQADTNATTTASNNKGVQHDRITNTVPNTFLFASQFPYPSPPNPDDPTDPSRLRNVERLQDGLYVSYLAVLRIEFESRSFGCAYEQLVSSLSSAVQVLSFLF